MLKKWYTSKEHVPLSGNHINIENTFKECTNNSVISNYNGSIVWTYESRKCTVCLAGTIYTLTKHTSVLFHLIT